MDTDNDDDYDFSIVADDLVTDVIDHIEETRDSVIVKVEDENEDLATPPPFLLPKVLSTLFEVCDPKDLKNVRLVCRSWFKNSLSSFREKTNVIIQTGRCPFGDAPRKVDIPTLLPLLNDPVDTLQLKQYPVQNVVLRDSPIKKWTLAGFWAASSPWLQSVELFDTVFLNEMNSVLDMMAQCPNLKRFKTWMHMSDRFTYNDVGFDGLLPRRQPLPVVPIDQLQNNAYLSDFHVSVLCDCSQRVMCVHHMPWSNVFGRYPSLKKLTIEANLLNATLVLEDIFEGIKLVRDSQLMTMEINHLEIDVISPRNFSYSEGLISKLCRVDLPLEVIKANFEHTPTPLVTRLIQSHQSTLSSMKCKLPKNSTPEEDDLLFQSFPVGLRQLTLYENKPLISLRSLQRVVNLQVLEYVPAKPSAPGHVGFYTGNLRGVTFRWEMVGELNMSRIYFPGSTLRQLTNCMPNVVKLTIALCDDTLEVVYSRWGNMNRLTFVGVGVTEEGILGSDDDDSVGQHGIARLRNLRYLEMEKVSLTERCVREGFLQLPYLQVLTMHGCDVNWGPETESVLAAHNAIVVVGIENVEHEQRQRYYGVVEEDEEEIMDDDDQDFDDDVD